jgi:hypothetical protein
MHIRNNSLIQDLADADVDLDDPRVIRLLMLCVKTRDHTLTIEEGIERFALLESLMLAQAKGKPV